MIVGVSIIISFLHSSPDTERKQEAVLPTAREVLEVSSETKHETVDNKDEEDALLGDIVEQTSDKT